MKKLLYIIILSCLFLPVFPVLCTNYYFSNSGDDDHDKCTINKPWCSLDRINNLNLYPGDSILLNGGDVFTGTIKINGNGDQYMPIVLASYGNQEKAILKGAIRLNDWKKKDNNWVLNSKNQIKHLFIDNNIEHPARYPDDHYLYFNDNANRVGMISDDDIGKIQNDLLKGANLRFRPRNWTFESREIYRHQGNTIEFDSTRLFNHQGVYEVRKGFEYYFDNKKEFISAPREWYYDSKTNLLFLKLKEDQKPADVNPEGVLYDYGVHLPDNSKYIHIQNIQIGKFEKAGIFIGKNSYKIEISNNTISDIYESGVHVDLNAIMLNIHDNIISDINGRGISVTESKQAKIINNHIRRIGLEMGYGINGNNNAIGIMVQNLENVGLNISDKNLVTGNLVDSIGYVGIRVDGCNNRIASNNIKNYLLRMNDGAAFYCYSPSQYDYTFNNVIEGNLIQNPKKIKHIDIETGKHIISNGIYLDGGAHNNIVRHNVIVNANTGIITNRNTTNNSIHDNIIFHPSKYGIFVAVADSIPLYHSIRNNVVVGSNENESMFMLFKHRIDTCNFGFCENNYYVNLGSSDYASIRHTPDNIKNFNYGFSLIEWRKESGKDLYSKTISKESEIILENRKYVVSGAELILQDGSEKKEIRLKKKYYDFLSNDFSDTYILPPSGAKVLLNIE